MDKKIVMPGDMIADSEFRAPNTYVEAGVTYATVVGVLDSEGKYIPLENKYCPALGDIVVGIILEKRPVGYSVDINLPNSGFISSKETREIFELGDFFMAKVKRANEVGEADLTDVRLLPRGKVVEFPSAKVPRLIGRKSSMLALLKEQSGGDIVVGNNGFVWISETGNIPLVLRAMKIIEAKAHLSGLTDEIAAFLAKQKVK